MQHGGDILPSGRLNEYEAKQLLRDAGIPCPYEVLFTDGEISEKMSYPAYVKICSRDIIHKSDAGLVLRVHSCEEAAEAARQIRERARQAYPDASIQGILISEDASTSQTRELLLGTTRDRDFGQVVSLGIGGISTELYADVAFRTIPLKESDVYDMLHQLQGRAVLGPFRGKNPVNLKALADVVLSFSAMVEKHPDIIEGDINPLLVDDRQAIAADAYLEVEP